MALYDDPVDQTLCDLTVAAVFASNGRIRELEESDRYIGTHTGFPKLMPNHWGPFPSISHSIQAGPTDYGGPFGLHASEGFAIRIAYADVPELAAVIDYVLADPELRARVSNLPVVDDTDYAAISAALVPLHILDRVRHTVGPEFDASDVRERYLDIEPTFFSEQLPIDILIPLVFTSFDSDTTEITAGVTLERLSDETQLARVPSEFGYWGGHRILVDAATHALVLKRWSMPRESHGEYNRPWFWPTDAIDTLLAAMRIASPIETGYAQLLIRPLGWASSWTADLEPLLAGPAVRRYPPHFENYYWLRKDYPTIDSDVLPLVGAAYLSLHDAPNPVPLAARRVNAAALRESDEDALIDACIGLEALFGDRGETTHKLSMRLAAVATRARLPGLNMTPAEVFRVMKHVYDYRSKLVHGDSKAEQKKIVSLSDGSTEPAHQVAMRLLRYSLLAVLAEPDLANPERVDYDLLLASLKPDGDERGGDHSGGGDTTSDDENESRAERKQESDRQVDEKDEE